MSGITIEEMTISLYEPVMALWKSANGIGLSAADSSENIERFLLRNPGLSFVARIDELIVGAALCGHDGRRGYIHHLAVRASHRRQGVGSALVEQCLSSLRAAGIAKCHLFVFSNNYRAIYFWNDTGWTRRTDLTVMSHYTDEDLP